MEGMALLSAFLILSASFCCASGAQSPSSGNDFCYKYSVDKLTPCLPYLATTSSGNKPQVDGKCCIGLRDIFRDEPQCVCFLIAPSNDISTVIDPRKAIFLPAPCNATVPPIIQCLRASSPDGAAPDPAMSAGVGDSATPFLAGILSAIVGAFL